jgi:uncharacterized membrane protein
MANVSEVLAEEKLGLERIIFFSDAVFAIAITLLALELRVPDLPVDRVAAEMPGRLLEMWPKFLSYVLTFLIVGVYWVAHHRDFQYIKRHNPPLIWINLLLLMSVAFLPFPSALLGTYPGQQITVTFYAVCLATVGFLKALMWWYASNCQRLVDSSLDPRESAHILRRSLVAPLVFLVSILIALFNPTLAMFSWSLAVLAVFAR